MNVVQKSFSSMNVNELCVPDLTLAPPFPKIQVADYHKSAHTSNVSCELTLSKVHVHLNEHTLAREELKTTLRIKFGGEAVAV